MEKLIQKLKSKNIRAFVAKDKLAAKEIALQLFQWVLKLL